MFVYSDKLVAYRFIMWLSPSLVQGDGLQIRHRRFESCQPLLVFIWAFLDCEDILQSIFLTNLEIGFKNVDIKIKEVFLDKMGK